MMQEKGSLSTTSNDGTVIFLKKTYVKPMLKNYGHVRQLTQSTGSQNGDAGQNMMASDRAAKENIVRIGTHPLGIGLYLFDYKPAYREQSSFGRQFGVMADEVEAVLPQAVVMHPDGYKRVDYALLGIAFLDQTVH